MRNRRPLMLLMVAALSAGQPVLAQAGGRGGAEQQQPVSQLDLLLAEWMRIDAQMKLASLVVFNVLGTQEERRALELRLAAVQNVKDPKERETKLIVVQGDAQAELAQMDFAQRAVDRGDELKDEQWQQLAAAAAILVDALPRGKKAIDAFKPAVTASMAQARMNLDAAKGLDKLGAGAEVARQMTLTALVLVKGASSLATAAKILADLNTLVANKPKPSPLAMQRSAIVLVSD